MFFFYRLINIHQNLSLQNPLLLHQSRFLNIHQYLEYATMFIIGIKIFDRIKIITMMKNYDESFEINHNSNWPYILDHHCRILIIDGWGSGKTNVLLKLMKHQRPDINKIYLYVKDPLESKYQLLI